VNGLAEWVVDRPRRVIVAWLAMLILGAGFAAQLEGVVRGSTDGIPGSPSEEALQALERGFGPDSAFVFPIVVDSPRVSVQSVRFRDTVDRLERALTAPGHVSRVRHFWNSGAADLLGNDGKSALMLASPRARTFYDAEILVAKVRDELRAVDSGADFRVMVTGPVAVFHDMNQHSAHDLLAAERVGVPLTLAILVLVFGAPLAAGLPLVLASAAVLISLAALYGLSHWMPVGIFARNAVAMIGLGVGVDYALFLLVRYRTELACGGAPRAALANAVARTAHPVLVSGLTVAAGFLVLLMVRIPMMRSLAVAGAAVVLVAVMATLTLLPALLSLLGERIFWPWKSSPQTARPWGFGGAWRRWALFVMRRPWHALVPALAVVTVFVTPVLDMKPWNPGAQDLPPGLEARLGADSLKAHFGAGWLGPIALVLEAERTGDLWQPARQEAVLAIADRLSQDARVARIGGFPVVLAALNASLGGIESAEALPPQLRARTAEAVSQSGKLALATLIPREAPENPQTLALVDDLRRDAWEEARDAGLRIRVAGASAGIRDFDRELFGALWRVIPAVLLVTYLMLMAQFRSLLIPAKAIVLNLLSVFASWGFLVLLFQFGTGAEAIGLEAPGGLNGFIVVMLFTVLFGLSMDYEVFLLSSIKEERDRGADNATAVARGLQRTAGTITSAALIMVAIFGSFAFTNLVTTRQFGFGLAFAVAFDASVIRVVLVPVLMRLMGERNWWLPWAGRKICLTRSSRSEDVGR
jgi:RND superfamily putative drug exporter